VRALASRALGWLFESADDVAIFLTAATGRSISSFVLNGPGLTRTAPEGKVSSSRRAPRMLATSSGWRR